MTRKIRRQNEKKKKNDANKRIDDNNEQKKEVKEKKSDFMGTILSNEKKMNFINFPFCRDDNSCVAK